MAISERRQALCRQRRVRALPPVGTGRDWPRRHWNERSAGYLREALLNPESTVPQDFLQVELATHDGTRITGVRLNEDAFSIQIRDLSGQFRSFWKSELAELNKQRGKSPMPSYQGLLNSAELDDVIAYLDSLRGAQ
jgi:putative heme-binding domain-containing protein